ncbi:MAG: YbhB/YbcL family Raf kinase inhibitor-like protein [Armatimonadota bacterium]|nr:YbhB/YbcL family Raf kinase inhibitor-like protein [Armatimonadota bacterium]
MNRIVLLSITVLAAVCLVPAGTSSALEKTIGKLTVTSSAFKDGGMIPRKYTADGANVSPPLAISGIPTAAKSLAIICDDPDAPRGTFVHWVLFNWPSGSKSIPENVPTKERLPNGAIQGKNDFGKIGYGGPAPPYGVHRYYFKAYALDKMLDLKPGITKRQLEDAMKGHILAQGHIMGRYGRK